MPSGELVTDAYQAREFRNFFEKKFAPHNESRWARVEKIHVDGLARTKNDIVTKHVNQLFSATNFEDMVRRAQMAKATLEGLGLFKKVNIAIDVSKGPDAKPDGYEVTFDVRESRRMTGGIGTMMGTNDASMVFNIRMPNAFGRGENISTQYTYGTKKALGCGITFSKPLQGNPNAMFQSTFFQATGEFPWSGFKEDDRGVGLDFTFPTILGNHNLRWEGIWREISCLTRTSAFAVREQCGHSIKSALKHTWSSDSRDNKMIPTTGYLLKCSQELAGIGGDAHFMKAEAEAQYNIPFILSSTLSLSLAAGVMKPLHPGDEARLPDRFFLGGPLTLRGYNLRGAGPSEDGCALGADTYWNSGLHLYTPLPFRPGKGGFGDLFRTHLFVNAGNLANVDFKGDVKDNFRRLAEDFRWSYGAGLVLKLGGVARLELNYCWPMRAQRGDSANPGIQLGVGVSFL